MAKERYSVLVLPYSLETGKVGQPIPHITSMDGEISRHRSLKAACRSLSKAISARLSRNAAWYIICDIDTGDDYSLRQAQGNVAVNSNTSFSRRALFGRS